MPRENSFIHNVGTGGDGSGHVRYFAGQGGRSDLGEPDSRGSKLTCMTTLANARASVTIPSRVWNRQTSKNVGG